MPAWLSSIVKLVVGILIDKFRVPIIAWIKDYIAKRKKAKEVDKAVEDLENAKSKKDYADKLSDLP